MTEKITPYDFLEVLRKAEKALGCMGQSCLDKCPIGFYDDKGKFTGCLSVRVKALVALIPEKCPTCGAVKNG